MAGRRAWVAVGLLLGVATLARADWADDVAAARRLYEQAKTPDQFQAAADMLQHALTVGVPRGRQADVYYWLGRARYGAKQAAAAVDALSRAVAGDAQRPDYRLWLGLADQLDDRATRCVKALRLVYADALTEPADRRMAHDVLTQLHEPPEAESLLPAASLSVPGAVIRCAPGDPFAADVREAVTVGRQRLADGLGLTLDEPVEVIVFPDRAAYQAYHEARKAPRPEWSTSCMGHGRIYTYPAGVGRDQLVSTLTHELTHVTVRAAAGDRPLPCWMDEGLAVLMSNQFPDCRRTVAKAPALLSLEALEVPSFGEYDEQDAYLAYAQSRAMTEDLLAVYGPGRLRAFLAGLGGSRTLDQAFRDAFGTSRQAFFGWWFKERARG